MLTSDLLRVRISGRKILPMYIDPDNEELLQLAKSLIEIFQFGLHSPRGELQRELDDFLGTGSEFRLHRGLAKLLLDRCEFETNSPIEPPTLREIVFQTAAESRKQGEAWDREQVWRAALEQLAETPDPAAADSLDAWERSLYADLKEEQILQSFREVSASWLLQRYNVSLAQSVLLRASQMEVRIASQPAARYRALFQKLKFFQLMHQIRGSQEEGYLLQLDGPVSLFKSSNKYGLQLASFLPTLLHCESWTLQAELLWGKKKVKKQFQLSSEEGLRSHTHLTGQWQPEEMQFLRIQFPKIKSDWTILEETELLDLGGEGVLAPDYVFEHSPSGQRVYMEILGFWRRGAVDSRLALLRRHGPKNLILAISRELHIEQEELEELPNDVYLFRSAPVASEMVKRLKKMESEFA